MNYGEREGERYRERERARARAVEIRREREREKERESARESESESAPCCPPCTWDARETKNTREAKNTSCCARGVSCVRCAERPGIEYALCTESEAALPPCESDVVTMALSVPWYGPEGVLGAPYGHGCCAGGAVAYWDACGSRVSGHGSAICTRARAHVAL